VVASGPIDFNDWGKAPEQERQEIDFQHVNDVAVANIDGFLSRYMPGGAFKGREYICASVSGGEGESCSINIETGVGSDFADGTSWGDPVEYIKIRYGLPNMAEAAKILMADMGITGNEPAPAKQKKKESQEARYERGRANAQALWWKGEPCSQQHPYLQRKKVWAASDTRQDSTTGAMLVPLSDEHGTVWCLQRIFPDGTKKVTADGKMGGNYFTFPGDSDVIYIAEGYSTAATIAELTGHMTVMAVSAGNLKPVGQKVATAYPRSEIVFAADYDDKGDGKNPGVKLATEARDKIGRGIVLPPPGNVKQDWNDYRQDKGGEATRRALAVEVKVVRLESWGVENFTGKPDPVEWVVENIMPRGKAATFAAQGDTGKGFMTLDLGLKIASGGGGVDLNKNAGWFGNRVAAKGKVVIVSAEDDLDELRRRIHNLDPTGQKLMAAKGNLFILPMPDACGPRHLVVGANGEFKPSPWFDELKDQLMAMDDLALINFDPLASFVGVDIDADNQAGQYVMGLLAHLAKQCNAAVMVAHHMRKGTGDTESPEAARRDIRGASSLVDGVRTAICLWQVGEAKSRTICKILGEDFKRGKVCQGAVVKANGPADREVKTFVRNNDTGLLECRSLELTESKPADSDLRTLLESDIKTAAVNGQPFCYTVSAQAGVFTRRSSDLSEPLRDLSRTRFAAMIEDLVKDKRVVLCTHGKAQTRWLDSPDGPLARDDGSYTFESGFLGKHEKK